MRAVWAPLLALVLLAGCSDGGKYDPSDRQDTNTVSVPANRGIEFKFYVHEGGLLEYTWTAPTALKYDFHGERAGDKSGAFTSHKTGTAGRDSGKLTAPFEGTHGWWWENRGSSPVSVNLETRGNYDVVGIIAG